MIDAKKMPAPPRRSRLPPVGYTTGVLPNNLTAAKTTRILQDLNFKVTPEEHQDFKIEAAMRGISMLELLRASLQAFRQLNGRMAPEGPAQGERS